VTSSRSSARVDSGRRAVARPLELAEDSRRSMDHPGERRTAQTTHGGGFVKAQVDAAFETRPRLRRRCAEAAVKTNAGCRISGILAERVQPPRTLRAWTSGPCGERLPRRRHPGPTTSRLAIQ
jgi:hypothetical protein